MRSYCDREFDGEKILVQHQTAKHFTCTAKNCGKRCHSVSALATHAWARHRQTLERVPNALEDRAALPKAGGHDVVGMIGIPSSCEPPMQRRAQAELQAAEQRQAEEHEAAEAKRREDEASRLEAEQAERDAIISAKSAQIAALNPGQKRAAPAAAAWGSGFSIGGGAAKKVKTAGAVPERQEAEE